MRSPARSQLTRPTTACFSLSRAPLLATNRIATNSGPHLAHAPARRRARAWLLGAAPDIDRPRDPHLVLSRVAALASGAFPSTAAAPALAHDSPGRPSPPRPCSGTRGLLRPRYPSTSSFPDILRLRHAPPTFVRSWRVPMDPSASRCGGQLRHIGPISEVGRDGQGAVPATSQRQSARPPRPGACPHRLLHTRIPPISG